MRHRLFIPLLLISATLAIFWPTINHGFVWDDYAFIVTNRSLHPASIGDILNFWTEPSKGLYIPLSTTTWSLLTWLSQYMPAEQPYRLNPALFHAANLFIHLAAMLVVFSILKMVIGRSFTKPGDNAENPDDFRTELTAAAGALIFAIHPVMVEPVAWASNMKDILCGLFSFLSIREYLVFAYASKYEKYNSRKNLHYILASMFFLLALFSKTTAVVVPIVAFILDHWAVKRTIKQSSAALAGWLIVAGLFAVIAKSVQQSDAAIVTAPFWALPLVAGDALAFYIYKLTLPLELGIDYGRKPNYVMQQWWIYVTWLLPFALAAAIWFSKKRGPWIVSMGIFVIALLPVLGFVPFLFQNHSTVADHYLYIPMLGASLFVSTILYNYRSKFVVFLFAVFIVFFVVRSSYQVSVWKSEVSVYEHALKVNPISATSHINLGMAHANTGNLEKAAHHYKQAIKFRANYAKAHNNLGGVLRTEGKLQEAAKHYKIAVKISPGIAEMHDNLGVVLALQRKFDEAIVEFKIAINIKPSLAPTHYKLGLVLAQQGKLEKAITHYGHALKLNPNMRAAKKQLQRTEAQLEKAKSSIFSNQ